MNDDESDDGTPDTVTLTHKIFMNEDLSSARVKLAYAARQLKRQDKITDTWVFDGKVKIKDNRNVIVNVRSLKDLVRYGHVLSPVP